MGDSNEPVQVYDSTADIDGHLYTVSGFTLKVDEAASFVVPPEWQCKEPSVPDVALVETLPAAKVYTPPLPTMPSEYALKVSYSITTAGQTAHYVTARTYNLNTTSDHVFQYREDDLVDGTLVATTV